MKKTLIVLSVVVAVCITMSIFVIRNSISVDRHQDSKPTTNREIKAAAIPEVLKYESPLNPQPGMIANVYNLKDIDLNADLHGLDATPSVLTFVDKTDTFSCCETIKEFEINVVSREGFVKCKKAMTFVFSFDYKLTYAVYVNNKQCVMSQGGQTSCTVNFRKGFNRVLIIQRIGNRKDELRVAYRPKDVNTYPRPFRPSMLFYDKLVEEVW